MLKQRISKIVCTIMLLGVSLNFVACGSTEEAKKSIKTPTQISQSEQYVDTMTVDDKVRTTYGIVDVAKEYLDNGFVKNNVNIFNSIDAIDELQFDKNGLNSYMDLYNLSKLYDDIANKELTGTELESVSKMFEDYIFIGIQNAYSQFTVQNDFFKFCKSMNKYVDENMNNNDGSWSAWVEENMFAIFNNGVPTRADAEIPEGLNDGWDMDEVDSINKEFAADILNDDELQSNVNKNTNMTHSIKEYEAQLQVLKDVYKLLNNDAGLEAFAKMDNNTIDGVPSQGMADYMLLMTMQDCETVVSNIKTGSFYDNIKLLDTKIKAAEDMLNQLK